MKKSLLLFVAFFIISIVFSLPASEFTKVSTLPENEKYYFNRNALKDFEIVDETIIALTESGNILQFDSDLNFTGELTDSLAYSCLGCIVGQELLVGREDGAIFMLNPKTLKRSLYAKVENRPMLITAIPDSTGQKDDVWVVYSQPLRNFVCNDSCWEQSTFRGGITIFKNLNSNISKTIEIRTQNCRGIQPCFVNYCRFDSRIYYGTSGNEFGSCFGYFDIQDRVFVSKDTSTYGAFGIDEFHDGKILSYGGNSHLGQLSNFISELNDTNESVMYSESYLGLINPDKGVIEDSVRLSGKPKHPINIILDDTKNQRYIVFTYAEAFEVDYNFKKWKLVYDYTHLYHFASPTITKTLIWKSGKILCSTRNDGFLILNSGTITNISVK